MFVSGTKRVETSCIGCGQEERSVIIYNVDAIERAIDENKQISFLYFDYDRNHNKVYRKNGEKYVVNPVVMVWDRNNYYLLCFSDNHENITTYRIDKMDKVFRICQ